MKLCAVVVTYYPDVATAMSNILHYFPFTAFQLFYKF